MGVASQCVFVLSADGWVSYITVPPRVAIPVVGICVVRAHASVVLHNSRQARIRGMHLCPLELTCCARKSGRQVRGVMVTVKRHRARLDIDVNIIAGELAWEHSWAKKDGP